MVRVMGTFDNWINQRDSEFISIVKCIDELASKNDSTIKATISYLFENLLTAKLYIDSGLHLTLVNNTGLLDLETPNEILTAIFSDIPPTFVNHCKSLPHSVSNKYAKYYIEKAALPIIETQGESPITNNSELVQQVAELQKQLEQVKAENQDLQKALLQKQVNDDNLNAFLYYPSDDRENDLKQLANHYDQTENEVIQELFNEQLDDIKPMVEFIQYIEKNNIQDENINRLFNLIKQSGQSVKFFSALSKAGFVPNAGEPSQSGEVADEKNPLKDIRTQNNLIRLLLAVNEMAKDKKGQSLDYSKDYNKENLQAINKKLDLLDYTNIGEAAFTTLATLIREKQGKGL